MGWLSDAWDGFKSVVSNVWEKTKEIAGKALNFMAEKAESFIGAVKEVWAKAKPFIESVIRPAIRSQLSGPRPIFPPSPG